MSKRKKFSIAEDINRGITEVINAVDNNVGTFRYEVIALSRLEVDPDNPRELLLSLHEINFGIDPHDPLSTKKQKEKEELESLAHTIKQNGVINPIMVYKHKDKYRIIAGERRFLAANLAKKCDVHARVIESKPNELDLRLLQWVENNERKNLSLHERLKNLEVIIEAYSKKNINCTITTDILKNLTGLSKTQAHCYLSVLKGPQDLKDSITNNIINNLDRAALIASIPDDSLRKKALEDSANGVSTRAIRSLIVKDKKEKTPRINFVNKRRGRVAQYVNLGRTKDIEAIKKLTDIIIVHPRYSQYAELFKNIKWNEYAEVSLAFHKLLKIFSD